MKKNAKKRRLPSQKTVGLALLTTSSVLMVMLIALVVKMTSFEVSYLLDTYGFELLKMAGLAWYAAFSIALVGAALGAVLWLPNGVWSCLGWGLFGALLGASWPRHRGDRW